MARFIAGLLLLLISMFAFAQTTRIIQPGDRIRMTCEEEPAISKEYEVSPEGTILVTFLGIVEVKNLTPAQAAEKVARQLEADRIVRRATVRVEFLGSAAGTVRFGGIVTVRGELPLREGMRLADVLAVARPLEDADLSRVQVKNRDGEVTTYNFAGNDVTNAQNPVMRAGDEVTLVPKTRGQTVLILGGVARPGVYEFREGLTVGEAIQGAGGFNSLAVSTSVRVNRNGTTLVFDVAQEAAGRSALQPGDQLIVDTVSARRYVRVNGGVMQPGLVEFVPGMTLLRAVQATGGLAPRAGAQAVTIVRANGSTARVDLGAIAAGYAVDVPLQPDDRIDVPGRGGSAVTGIGGRRDDSLVRIAAGVLLFFLFGR